MEYSLKYSDQDDVKRMKLQSTILSSYIFFQMRTYTRGVFHLDRVALTSTSRSTTDALRLVYMELKWRSSGNTAKRYVTGWFNYMVMHIHIRFSLFMVWTMPYKIFAQNLSQWTILRTVCQNKLFHVHGIFQVIFVVPLCKNNVLWSYISLQSRIASENKFYCKLLFVTLFVDMLLSHSHSFRVNKPLLHLLCWWECQEEIWKIPVLCNTRGEYVWDLNTTVRMRVKSTRDHTVG